MNSSPCQGFFGDEGSGITTIIIAGLRESSFFTCAENSLNAESVTFVFVSADNGSIASAAFSSLRKSVSESFMLLLLLLEVLVVRFVPAEVCRQEFCCASSEGFLRRDCLLAEDGQGRIQRTFCRSVKQANHGADIRHGSRHPRLTAL